MEHYMKLLSLYKVYNQTRFMIAKIKISYSTLQKIKPYFVLLKLDFKFPKSAFNFIKQGFNNALSINGKILASFCQNK